MSYTVPAAFDAFRQNIELTGDHRETAQARRDRLVSLLEKKFTVLEAFPAGSIPRYTALRVHADLDVLVALHYGKHIKDKKPSTVLQDVRDCLADYRTGIRRNGQAVTLYYDTWPNIDIVPAARYVDANNNIDHYEIPDMDTETWIRSNPRKHSEDMTNRNQTCGPLFKRIIKMIKWWNKQHSDLLESYHMEVLALNILSAQLSEYSWNVLQFFDKAISLAGSTLWHEGSIVDGYLTNSNRDAAVKRLETARDKARAAWYATAGGNSDHEAAIGLWRQIFGDAFPAYGS